MRGQLYRCTSGRVPCRGCHSGPCDLHGLGPLCSQTKKLRKPIGIAAFVFHMQALEPRCSRLGTSGWYPLVTLACDHQQEPLVVLGARVVCVCFHQVLVHF